MQVRDNTSIEIPNFQSASGSRTWPVTIVDSVVSGHIALTLDLQGGVHLSYWKNQETTKGQLFYAQQAGNEWSQEVVTTAQGAQTAIAVTNGGQLLIAYFDLDNAQLMLARKSAIGWEIESVKSSEDASLVSFAPGALCLAIDDQDQPVITYYDNDALKLAPSCPPAPSRGS